MLESLSLSVGVKVNDCRVLAIFDHLDIVSHDLELGPPDTVATSNDLVRNFEDEELSNKFVHVLVN